MLLEHGIDRGGVQNAVGPAIELFQSSRIEAHASCFVERAEALDKEAFQDCRRFFGFAFDLPFDLSF